MAFSVHETLVIEPRDAGSDSSSEEPTQLRGEHDVTPPTTPVPTRLSVAPGTSNLYAATPTKPATTVEEFVGRLVKSRLFTAEQMAAIVAAIAPADHRTAATGLARRLAADGTLTDYQAAVLLRGSSQPLIIDDYHVLEIAGTGGVATLYKARRRHAREAVALKVRNLEADPHGNWRERFVREGRAMALVDHPHVVRSYAAVHREDLDYFVLEYVAGPNLEELLRQKKQLPLREALQHISDAARGLAAAHSRGLVHRDVKPSNLLLDSRERVKIADFGLVRFDESQAGSLNIASDDLLTKSGTLMGTPHYMAPEQALDARTADARSDIYSLGCTLFFLLTGRPPYHGDTVIATLHAHQNAAIPLLDRFRPDVPADVQRIFARMIAKQPRDRYQAIVELLADLSRWTGEPATLSMPGAPAPGRRRWWNLWGSWRASA